MGSAQDGVDKEWMINSGFNSTADPWTSSVVGDTTDLVTQYVTDEQADYKVIGDYRTFSLAEVTPHIDNWTIVNNPELTTFPDTYEINSNGMYVSHFWTEAQSGQLTSVHWSRNITMPVDMSDYMITSASISVVVNGTVSGNDGYGNGDGGVEAFGDYTNQQDNGPFTTPNIPQFSTYDYVRFYSLISDVPNNISYEIAQYQTGGDTYPLGHDTNYTDNTEYLTQSIDRLNDTYMFTVPEESLKFFLGNVLSTDDQNFTFTMGMKIWCEDNFLNDDDDWHELIIKDYNLTFGYEKIIDRDSYATWTQEGNSILEENAQIINGIVKFKYKTDTLWAGYLPNSEFRVRINGNLHNEAIKLSTATSVFQEALSVGFNVTNLLQKDVNLSLTIELYVSDEFALGDNITVSITDAQLWVAYILVETPPPPIQKGWGYLIGLVTGATLLLSGFAAYEGFLKYPAEVRLIRSMKRKVRGDVKSKLCTKKMQILLVVNYKPKNKRSSRKS